MFDNPIFFIILISIISAISEWLTRRRKTRSEEESSGGGETFKSPDDESERAERRRKVREQEENWEAKLRRLLEGELPVEEMSPKPIAPPPTPVPAAETHSIDAEKQHEFRPSVSQKDKNVKESTIADRPISLISNSSRKVKRASWLPDFESKTTIRKAVVASVILGSPKGFDENSDLLRL